MHKNSCKDCNHIVLQASLKDVVEQKVIEKQNEVKEFRASHGETKVGEVTVNMVLFICIDQLN